MRSTCFLLVQSDFTVKNRYKQYWYLCRRVQNVKAQNTKKTDLVRTVRERNRCLQNQANLVFKHISKNHMTLSAYTFGKKLLTVSDMFVQLHLCICSSQAFGKQNGLMQLKIHKFLGITSLWSCQHFHRGFKKLKVRSFLELVICRGNRWRRSL